MSNLIKVLILFITCSAYANEAVVNKAVNVLAIEYPPYTTLKSRDGGIAFKILVEKSKNAGVIWRPQFVPPGRAARLIESGQWCASFYPDRSNLSAKEVNLSDEVIRIGLVRKKQDTKFSWTDLSELAPGIVAHLRTNESSVITKEYKKAKLDVVFIDSIEAAVQMVELGRADYAMFDNVSFNQMEKFSKERLQFSSSSLFETKISVFLNPQCDFPDKIKAWYQ